MVANTQSQVLKGEVKVDLANGEGLLQEKTRSAAKRSGLASVQVYLHAVSIFERHHRQAVDSFEFFHLRYIF